ncbi:hypothetical protein BGZ47_001028, partial [Haplosporangium gracile]
DLKESLRNQPDDVESEIVHFCLKEWTTDPSPFSVVAPERDWAVAEAAPDWDPISDKYKFESAFKLPR